MIERPLPLPNSITESVLGRDPVIDGFGNAPGTRHVAKSGDRGGGSPALQPAE